MSLLFNEPLIAGLGYGENFITESEERQLLDHLAPLELAPFRFHGWLGNRKTQSFGCRVTALICGAGGLHREANGQERGAAHSLGVRAADRYEGDRRYARPAAARAEEKGYRVS
jgi:hypothetical protein